MAEPQKKKVFEKYSSPPVTMGYTIMAAILLFSFIGYKLDQKLKTQYWTLVGVFVGFAYSGYEVWKLIKKEQKEEKENKEG